MRRGSGVEAEREKEREEMGFVLSYLLRGVFIRPTVFPYIHYLHTLLGNTSRECAPDSHLSMSFSSFCLFSYLGSAGRLVVVVNIAQRGKRHARVAAAAVTLR